MHLGMGVYPGGFTSEGGSASGGGDRADSPEIHGILRAMVNKPVVCIVLECILVYFLVLLSFFGKQKRSSFWNKY